MKLQKLSELTGVSHTMDIPLTEEEYKQGLQKWKSGMLIQNAFPTLNADQREFIMTGITPEEWGSLFKTKRP
jgi:hypothetical protein